MSNFSDRIKNLQKKISEFQKEDNINNVAMSSNNNTQSARVSYNIENQLGKQHLFNSSLKHFSIINQQTFINSKFNNLPLFNNFISSNTPKKFKIISKISSRQLLSTTFSFFLWTCIFKTPVLMQITPTK
jgi:hypothetical protein